MFSVDKVTEIFHITGEFYEFFDVGLEFGKMVSLLS